MIEDIQTMKNLVTGLSQKKKNLRADEAIFLKLTGINEEIEKASQEKTEIEEEITEAKKARDSAKAKKAAAVSETTAEIAGQMNQVLPFGSAIFSYDEDDEGKRSMKIGWEKEEKTTPYNGLSGGEKQIFDAALANILEANIIVVEAAELDEGNLHKTLKELAKLDKQCIVNTCHPITGDIPETFKVIEV